jgi:hypothetical protein
VNRSVAERQVLGDAVKVSLVHDIDLAEPAAALGVFGLGQMASAGWKAGGFAGAGDLEPFGHGFFGLNTFGASHKSISCKKERELYLSAPFGASVKLK